MLGALRAAGAPEAVAFAVAAVLFSAAGLGALAIRHASLVQRAAAVVVTLLAISAAFRFGLATLLAASSSVRAFALCAAVLVPACAVAAAPFGALIRRYGGASADLRTLLVASGCGTLVTLAPSLIVELRTGLAGDAAGVALCAGIALIAAAAGVRRSDGHLPK